MTLRQLEWQVNCVRTLIGLLHTFLFHANRAIAQQAQIDNSQAIIRKCQHVCVSSYFPLVLLSTPDCGKRQLVDTRSHSTQQVD